MILKVLHVTHLEHLEQLNLENQSDFKIYAFQHDSNFYVLEEILQSEEHKFYKNYLETLEKTEIEIYENI